MTAISEALSDEPSSAEVFRAMHDLLEGVAQIAENHGFVRGGDLQVWLAQSLRSGNGGEVRVKPLEWVEDGETATASALGITYNLFLRDGVWKGYADGYASWFLDPVGTITEAKAAAQQDFKSRILSALDIKP